MKTHPNDDVPDTQAEIKRLDARIDGIQSEVGELREEIRRVVTDRAKLHGLIHDEQRRQTEARDRDTSKILDVVVSFVSQVQTIDRRQVITSRRVNDLETRVDAWKRRSSG